MAHTVRELTPGPDGLTFALAARADAAARARALPIRLAVARFDAWCSGQWSPGRAGACVAELALALGGRLHDDTDALRERVRRALVDGRVLALREGRTDARAAARPHDEAEHEAGPVEPREVKTWVTIRLVDDGDPPRPVRHARYRVKLPDGTVREGQLNGDGIAHFEGIDPGTCEVTFPDYDREAWRRAK